MGREWSSTAALGWYTCSHRSAFSAERLHDIKRLVREKIRHPLADVVHFYMSTAEPSHRQTCEHCSQRRAPSNAPLAQHPDRPPPEQNIKTHEDMLRRTARATHVELYTPPQHLLVPRGRGPSRDLRLPRTAARRKQTQNTGRSPSPSRDVPRAFSSAHGQLATSLKNRRTPAQLVSI